MKYPIGIQSFDQIVKGGWAYVDKTALVYQLVTMSSVCFLSRPRRFGKSLLLSTIECYFRARKELFKGLAMEKLEKEWAVHPVFKLDFNGDDYTQPDTLANKIEGFIASAERIYGREPACITPGDRFREVLRRAYENTGQRAVVLIDEYDKPILDVLNSPIEDTNCNILKAFYSTFKSADAYLQFVMVTGVTKYSQMSVFYDFNQHEDIGMNYRYETICGITQEELEHYFAEPITEMAKAYKCSYDEMLAILKRQYGGYHFGENMTDIYNPFNILNAFYSKDIYSYWYASGNPAYLLMLLKRDKKQMNEFTGRYYFPNMFEDYREAVEKPLPMIYQSGYLTIKDFDMDSGEYLLDYPNDEVRNGFLTMIANDYFHFTNGSFNSWIQDAAFLLEDDKTEEFHQSLTAFLSSIPYDSHESTKTPEATEKHFQYTFYLILRLLGGAGCRLMNEQVQAKGRVDCVIEYPQIVYIFEFKLDGSAEEALKQIEAKNYAKPYLNDPRTLVKIGVNFSSDTRTVEDWKQTN